MLKFDAESIKQRLKERLQATVSWSKILFHSTNQRIIDVVAEEIGSDMLYDEVLTIEGKWNLARQISSLMSENKFFNYFPHRKTGAINNLKLSSDEDFNKAYGLPIIVPKYAMCSNGDIYFCSSKDQSITTSQTSAQLEFVQGIAKQETFVAKGSEFEKFIIYNDSIENDHYDIVVNNELYERVSSIREAANKDSKVYTIDNLNDFSGVELKFGNGYFGRKLEAGDVVLFKYIETLGASGNIESINTITDVISTFYDSSGQKIDLYCTNDVAFVGGQDYEDIESIRDNAPKSYKSGDTAITKTSYKYIMEKFSFVKKVNIWGEAEVNEDLGNEPGTFIAGEENVVHVAIISTSDTQISEYQKQIIRTSINEKKSPTDIIVFEDVNLIYINFVINAYIINKNYTITYVSDGITSAVNTAYSISKLDFKKQIYQSDFISTIKSVDGVGFHETNFKLYCFTHFTSAYVFSRMIYVSNIKPSSVKLYIKNDLLPDSYSLFAQDDGYGNLVSTGTAVIGLSSVDYDEGFVTCTLTSGFSEVYANYSIKIVFEVVDESIIPTQRNQIISIGDSTISVQYA